MSDPAESSGRLVEVEEEVVQEVEQEVEQEVVEVVEVGRVGTAVRRVVAPRPAMTLHTCLRAAGVRRASSALRNPHLMTRVTRATRATMREQQAGSRLPSAA